MFSIYHLRSRAYIPQGFLLQLPVQEAVETPSDFPLSFYDRNLKYSQPFLLDSFISLYFDMCHLLPELSN